MFMTLCLTNSFNVDCFCYEFKNVYKLLCYTLNTNNNSSGDFRGVDFVNGVGLKKH